MSTPATDRFLTTDELAERYRTTTSTVHGWIYKGTAPPSCRIGKRRLFKVSDVLKWEDERAGEGTAA